MINPVIFQMVFPKKLFNIYLSKKKSKIRKENELKDEMPKKIQNLIKYQLNGEF